MPSCLNPAMRTLKGFRDSATGNARSGRGVARECEVALNSNHPPGDLPIVTRIPAGAKPRLVKVFWRGQIDDCAWEIGSRSCRPSRVSPFSAQCASEVKPGPIRDRYSRKWSRHFYRHVGRKSRRSGNCDNGSYGDGEFRHEKPPGWLALALVLEVTVTAMETA
jgi:hypothetical protein